MGWNGVLADAGAGQAGGFRQGWVEADRKWVKGWEGRDGASHPVMKRQ